MMGTAMTSDPADGIDINRCCGSIGVFLNLEDLYLCLVNGGCWTIGGACRSF